MPVDNIDPPVGAPYQSTVSPDNTLALIDGMALSEQYSLSPPLNGGATKAQSQSGAVTSMAFEQLLAFTVRVILVPEGIVLIDHTLPLVFTTVPEVLVTVPELTVTSTEYVDKSVEQVGGVVIVMVGMALTVATIAVLEAVVHPLAVASA